MTNEIINEIAKICKAYSDPERLKIVCLIKEGEKCANEILEYFGFSQPTLSHHMNLLVDAGILERRKDKQFVYYSLSKFSNAFFEIHKNYCALLESYNELLINKK